MSALLSTARRAAVLSSTLAATASATATAQSAQPPRDTVATDSARTIMGVRVTADRPDAPRPAMQALTLPAIVTVTRQQVERTVNVVDVQDAVKYLPSVFVRKRNNGDTQAVLGTRVWGVSSSARTLVFADGMPLSALVANNNTIGGPRWGLVSPVEIARVDMMYGPFSAAYAGNSMGAVMEITTQLPQGRRLELDQTQAVQRFSLYGTTDSYATTQTNGAVGDRFGRFAFWLSGSYADSHSQPLSYVTSASFPANTTGGFADRNKLGAAANVLGATGLLHTGMTNGKVKLAYDLTPSLRLAYTGGIWRNEADAGVDSYLHRTTGGTATFAGLAGFASGYYRLVQRHSSHSVSLRTNGDVTARRDWDGEVIATRYRFDKDQQRTPSTAAATADTFGVAGRLAVLDGTGWETVDLKGAWHRGGVGARHTVTAGAHVDRYTLVNPTYTTSNWRDPDARTGVATQGDGRTRTAALWAQDSWRVVPAVTLTVGGRWEDWRGYDGYNVNGATRVTQPVVSATTFSPKAIVAWDAAPQLTVTGSVGKAYRFATAAELYQLVSTGVTFTAPDPNLKPDDVLAGELRVERRFPSGTVQLAGFTQDVHDAIVAQFLPLVPGSNTLYSAVSNVDHVRATGAELVFGTRDLGLRGLEVQGSATYLSAKILALSGRASATAPAGSAVGKFLPNIPRWRGTVTATYRPVDRLALSTGGRYSGRLYTTLDNSDVRFNTWQGFDGWFVMDAKASYRLDRHLALSLGADNVLNRKYFLFHPFPQRTFVGNLKYTL